MREDGRVNAFFTDLDGTLIYSHRRNLPEPRIAVEIIHGREQSHMAEETFAFLKGADWLQIVPVTTRTEEQYRRLLRTEELRIRQAILCNGGKLLTDGREDPDWTAETMARVRMVLPALEEAADLLRSLSPESEIRHPEPYYFYAAAEDPAAVCSALKKKIRGKRLQAFHDRRKVYLFPDSIRKGDAVRRFIRRFGVGVSAAAGDGPADVTMLNAVDLPMAAEAIFGRVRNAEKRKLGGEIISGGICEQLGAWHREGRI